MRHIDDSGCGGPVGIPRDRRHACVSSCIWLCPSCAWSIAVPVVSQGWEWLSAVSVAVARCCAWLHRDISPVCHHRGSSGPGTLHVPMLSHPSTTCTCSHRAAKQGLWMAPMSLPAPWCPCHYSTLFPALALLLPGPRLSLGDPAGDGSIWGCSPGPGEQGRGRRELGAPGDQALTGDAARGPCTLFWAC